MAKNTTKNTGAAESNVVTINDAGKSLTLHVKRTIPIVRIDREACRQLFGLVDDKATGKLCFAAKDSGSVEPISLKNVTKWAKLQQGWNVGNRPIDSKHVTEIVSMMVDDTYHRWAGNMIVIADNPHHENAKRSMCNSQHTTAATAIALSEGLVDWKYIELIYVDDFTDDIVDLLDNSKQRTTADAIARRGIADKKDAKIVQSVCRFLQFRYLPKENAKPASPVAAKDKVNLIKAVHSLMEDERFKPIVNILSELHLANGKIKTTNNGKSAFVPKSKGVLSRKFDVTKNDFPVFGLPLVWWTLAGTILVNGQKCSAREFGNWANRLAFGDEKKLNIVESALKLALIEHGKKEKTGTAGHWAICQSLLRAWNLCEMPHLPKKAPVFPDCIDVIVADEIKTNVASNSTDPAGMFWQGENDQQGAADEWDFIPYTGSVEPAVEVDAEMMDDESDE